jgi:hypothetical protein
MDHALARPKSLRFLHSLSSLGGDEHRRAGSTEKRSTAHHAASAPAPPEQAAMMTPLPLPGSPLHRSWRVRITPDCPLRERSHATLLSQLSACRQFFAPSYCFRYTNIISTLMSTQMCKLCVSSWLCHLNFYALNVLRNFWQRCFMRF